MASQTDPQTVTPVADFGIVQGVIEPPPLDSLIFKCEVPEVKPLDCAAAGGDLTIGDINEYFRTLAQKPGQIVSQLTTAVDADEVEDDSKKRDVKKNKGFISDADAAKITSALEILGQEEIANVLKKMRQVEELIDTIQSFLSPPPFQCSVPDNVLDFMDPPPVVDPPDGIPLPDILSITPPPDPALSSGELEARYRAREISKNIEQFFKKKIVEILAEIIGILGIPNPLEIPLPFIGPIKMPDEDVAGAVITRQPKVGDLFTKSGNIAIKTALAASAEKEEAVASYFQMTYTYDGELGCTVPAAKSEETWHKIQNWLNKTLNDFTLSVINGIVSVLESIPVIGPLITALLTPVDPTIALEIAINEALAANKALAAAKLAEAKALQESLELAALGDPPRPDPIPVAATDAATLPTGPIAGPIAPLAADPALVALADEAAEREKKQKQIEAARKLSDDLMDSCIDLLLSIEIPLIGVGLGTLCGIEDKETEEKKTKVTLKESLLLTLEDVFVILIDKARMKFRTLIIGAIFDIIDAAGPLIKAIPIVATIYACIDKVVKIIRGENPFTSCDVLQLVVPQIFDMGSLTDALIPASIEKETSEFGWLPPSDDG